MATTQNTYTGNGSTTDYSITFEYLKDADVKVTLDHVATTAFTLPNATTLRFTTAPGNNVAIRIFRDTDVDAARFVYSAGSAIKAAELNENADQALYGLQETVNTDDITDEAVTTAKLRDGAVTTAKFGNISITTSKLADSSVTTAKIAADAVNGTKIADDSINSEHYVDGSIDTAHIADAQITTAKIADDAVTADKLANTAVTAGSYTAADITVDAQGRVTAASSGTIGTSEIANDAVTTAKILDANVTTAKIADDAVTTAKIADAELVELATMGGNTASALADLTQSEVQILDGATVTTAELNILDGVTATATELNQLDGNTLKTTGTDFTSSSQFPAASEIDARITARIDPLGGFEAIADEDSFPATAPPAGTVISIANANSLAVNSSGVGAGTRAGGSDAVVINGFPSTFNSTSLDDGIGLLVIATSTAHTYDFHRVVAKNEDVRQLSSDINDFKARYRIGSSNPTTDNDAGDLFFNTGTSKMLVYNATSSAWEEVQAVGDFFINTLSSSSGTGGGSATFNGTAYRFTLSNAPTYAQQLLVSVNGVVQKPNSGTSQPSEGFAIDGSDIILAAAPATGADAFFITIGSSVGIGTPSDNTISTAKVIDGAVTTAKLAADAVTGAKIADDAVGAEHIEVLDANLQFADNAKAQFGTGNDLEIYHDGTKSYIEDSGTGSLRILSNDLRFYNAANNEFMARFQEDGAATLYYNGNAKFVTKTDGIDVTGEVQCDSLDVDGGHINLESGYSLQWGDSHERIEQSDQKLEFFTNNGQQMTLSGSNLGIGTNSPDQLCHINKTSGTTLYKASVAGNSTVGLEIVKTGATTQSWRIADGQTVNGKLEFYDVTDSATRMCIDGSGNAGFGTTSPNHRVTLHNSGTGTFDAFNITSGLTNSNGLQLGIDSASNVFFWHTANGAIRFATNNVERVRVTNNGLTFNGDTAAANALDDYEEGTWTPTLTTSSGSLTVSYSSNNGKYTKIGNVCHVSFQMRVSSHSGGSGGYRISGLPFNAVTSNNDHIGVSTAGLENHPIGSTEQLIQVIDHNTDRIRMLRATSGGGWNVYTPNSQFGIWMSFTYPVG